MRAILPAMISRSPATSTPRASRLRAQSATTSSRGHRGKALTEAQRNQLRFQLAQEKYQALRELLKTGRARPPSAGATARRRGRTRWQAEKLLAVRRPRRLEIRPACPPSTSTLVFPMVIERAPFRRCPCSRRSFSAAEPSTTEHHPVAVSR